MNKEWKPNNTAPANWPTQAEIRRITRVDVTIHQVIRQRNIYRGIGNVDNMESAQKEAKVANYVCDVCVEPVDKVTKYKTMMLCDKHLKEEQDYEIKRNSPEEQQKRVEAHNAAIQADQILVKAKKIDQTITVREDIFNAETVSIVEIKAAIDAEELDDLQKNNKLAEILSERQQHLGKLIFDRNEQNVADATRQRSIQQYLNELANKVSEEVREKIKLRDINYKPPIVKITKPAATPKVKLDKVLLRDVTTELNKWLSDGGFKPYNETALWLLCQSRKMTIPQAAELIRTDESFWRPRT